MSEGKIDFDLLRQVLSEELVEGDDERYRLDWVGKKASLFKANLSIDKTLRPCVDESVAFDTTENLYIGGDNFEVLKLIGESYLNKIKMIYIDPPYNTGKDFKIPTPIGEYNPDWAIVFEKSDKKEVYFIAETKGNCDLLQLKGAEEAKIAYAKKYFGCLNDDNISYDCVASYEELIEKVLG